MTDSECEAIKSACVEGVRKALKTITSSDIYDTEGHLNAKGYEALERLEGLDLFWICDPMIKLIKGGETSKMSEIKVGKLVKLLYWKDNKIHDFTITDIFFEDYVSGYKTIIKAKYYSEKSHCYFTETYFSNDFFKAMADATKLIESKEENEQTTWKLIIDIPEDSYRFILQHGIKDTREIDEVIANGIPLPKGHGDLIDRDKLSHIYRQMSYCSTAPDFIWVSELMSIEPVIKADKENDNGTAN